VALRCDVRHFPLVTFTQKGTLSFADIHYNHGCLQAILRLNRPFASVYDARAGLRHDPAHNKAYSDVFHAVRGEMERLCVGVAYIVDSVLLRMALRGFLLVMRPPFPYSVTSSVDEAERWCQAQLAVRVSG
jgi:hypothetical protein